MTMPDLYTKENRPEAK